MKLTVCIPNYNYARYLGRTLQSLLSQELEALEVVVADNASTDGSVALIEGVGDPRVRVKVNQCNVGFARNLDMAAQLARPDWAGAGRMIMLSSDDLVRPGALATYEALEAALIEAQGPEATAGAVFCASAAVIDPDDETIGALGPDPTLFFAEDLDPGLSEALGQRVYRIEAGALLGRALGQMKNPLNFLATCYPRRLYEAVEGYGGGRLINPDKWFAWRLLAEAREVLWVDAPLFAYRWHPANQSAQQAASGALKFLVDEYTSTLEAGPELLERAGVDREALIEAFVRHDVARHGLATLAKGQRRRARRVLDFGRAAYPEAVARDRLALGLRALLALGPGGELVARGAYALYRKARGEA